MSDAPGHTSSHYHYVPDRSPRSRARTIAVLLILALVVTAVVLAVRVARAAADDPVERVAVGDTLTLRAPLYGTRALVRLPGSEVGLVVADPVAELDSSLVDRGYRYDPEAPDVHGVEDDGLLVAVSWSVRALGGFLREDDPTPIGIRLLAGDQDSHLATVVLGDTSSLSDAYRLRTVAIAVPAGTTVDDLAVEVEYDGVTQTADAATGEIDAGAAEALYAGDVDLDTACADVQDQCQLQAGPDSALRVDRATVVASDVTLYPYDATYGWAEDGMLWAGVRLHLLSHSGALDADGRYRRVVGAAAPTVTLDGAPPAHVEGLEPDETSGSIGRVVFEVDADTLPRRLALAQVLTLRGDRAPRTLTVEAVLALTR